ncbi:MAG: hypothetical protein Q7S89_03470 [bacterium]|nr:hypothetical protein [bacterium]
MATRYVCTGVCGGSVSEEEYNEGKTTCGAETCPNFQQPFEKRMVCDACGVEYKEGEEHSCG